MDTQTMVNIGAGAFIAILGWFARVLWEAVTMLREDLHKLEVDLPSNYIRRDEFQDGMAEIKAMLGKIFDKLDGKQDK